MKRSILLYGLLSLFCMAQGTLQKDTDNISAVNNEIRRLRIPKNFDLKGTNRELLMRMLKENNDRLHQNEATRYDLHGRFLWTFHVISSFYAVLSAVWIVANLIFYIREKRKFENEGEENNVSRYLERERLLQRYNEMPSAEVSLMGEVTGRTFKSVCNSTITEPLSDAVTEFEAKRAKVEAVLKRNNEPQFMRRI